MARRSQVGVDTGHLAETDLLTPQSGDMALSEMVRNEEAVEGCSKQGKRKRTSRLVQRAVKQKSQS